VESPDTPRIGVGEATIPTMRDMLRSFGIAEGDFMRSCDASFKQAIRFDDWSGPGSRYMHPFHRHRDPVLVAAAAEWLAGRGTSAFENMVSVQPALIERGLAPRPADGPDYVGPVPYAYHMDAEMFADGLAEHCMARGVLRQRNHVERIERDERGRVIALWLREGQKIEGDLFVDCTGFRALLSPQAHEAGGWVDQSRHLLCDSAVAFRVPEDQERFVPKPFTRARALQCGWCWDIGLMSRRGRGYVYSSAHSSPDAAEAELRAEEGQASEGIVARHLQFRVGRQVAPWTGNVVAIGLSAGFLEPLESTGLYLADFAARVLCEMFPPTPDAAANPALARRHNQLMTEVHDDILDFIQVHFAVAGRRDTAFWRDAADKGRLTDRLAHLLGLWDLRPPRFSDFSSRYSPFNDLNYEFILLGSGWRPNGLSLSSQWADTTASLHGVMTKITSALPANAAMLAQIHRRNVGQQ
jgi:tryptophan halogenase